MSEATESSGGLDFFRRHRRWMVVALLFAVALVNNLDRQTLSVLAPTLRGELHFTEVEYSYVVSAFLAAYTVGYLFAGRVLDRLGVRLGLALALGVWSFVAVGHAAVNGWIALALLRFALGLGESFNSPAGVKAAAEWIPPRERGLSMALITNGNIVGAIVAPPLVALLALHFGWRWAFVGTGGLGLVLLFVWLRGYYSPETHPGITAGERAYILEQLPPPPEGVPRLAMLAMLRHPLFLGFFFVRFCTDPLNYFLSFWLPDYFMKERGLSLAGFAVIGWLPYLAADLGGPVGGAISDLLVRRGWRIRRARFTLMAFAAVAIVSANVAVRTDLLWLSFALIALIYAAQTCWMANQLAMISESTGRQNAATVLSLSALGGSLGGIAANLFTGRIVQTIGYTPVFTAFSCMHLLGFAILVYTARRADHRV